MTTRQYLKIGILIVLFCSQLGVDSFSQCESEIEKYYDSFAPSYPNKIPDGWHYVIAIDKECKSEKRKVRIASSAVVEIVTSKAKWAQEPYPPIYTDVTKEISSGKINNALSIIRLDEHILSLYFIFYLEKGEESIIKEKTDESSLTNRQIQYSNFFTSQTERIAEESDYSRKRDLRREFELQNQILAGKLKKSGFYLKGKKVSIGRQPNDATLETIQNADQLIIYEDEIYFGHNSGYAVSMTHTLEAVLSRLLPNQRKYATTFLGNESSLKSLKIVFCKTYPDLVLNYFFEFEVSVANLEELIFITEKKGCQEKPFSNSYIEPKPVEDIFKLAEQAKNIKKIDVSNTTIGRSLNKLRKSEQEQLISKLNRKYPQLKELIY